MNPAERSPITTAKPFLDALAGRIVDPPPVWLMRQAGRYLPEYRATRAAAGSFLDLCYDPARAAEVTLQPIRRFGFDAAIIFSDILVVPHALGQKVWFEEGAGPRLDPIRDAAGLRALDGGAVPGRLEPVYEAIRRTRGALPERVAMIGFAGAPWTIATYMIEGGGSRDFIAAKGWAYRDPASFDRLIALLVGAIADHLVAQITAGAEAVQIFDTWAGALPEDALARWSLAPIAAIAARVKAAHPAVPVIAFPRGVGPSYRDFAAIAAIDGLSLDTSIAPAWAAAELGAARTLQGNLDPVRLVAGGSGLDEAVERIRTAFAGRPFVFNLGHGILPSTPPEHVAHLVERVRGPRA